MTYVCVGDAVVAHALVRAAPALMPALWCGFVGSSVHTSVNAEPTSACATGVSAGITVPDSTGYTGSDYTKAGIA